MILPGERDVMLKTSGRLPPGCRELEYIESTGTQWIDTGLRNLGGKEIIAMGSFLDNQVNGILYGSRDSTYDVGAFQTGAGFRELRVMRRFLSTGIYAHFAPFNIGDKYEFINTSTFIAIAKNGITISSMNISMPAIALANSITLFKINGTNWTLGKSRLHRYTVWDNGIRISDFIPVLDRNGEPKIFDLVTQTYPEHHGTFIAGPVALANRVGGGVSANA